MLTPLRFRPIVMSLPWIWWTLALVLAAAELLTGTFHLLAIGVAMGAGGLAAYVGLSIELQFLIAAVLGIVLVGLAHKFRVRRGEPALQPSLDLGQLVTVQQWKPDGTARVAYRGSVWDAEVAGAHVKRTEPLYIVDTRGSLLVLDNQRRAR